jgi:hypothetical protein
MDFPVKSLPGILPAAAHFTRVALHSQGSNDSGFSGEVFS